MFKTRMNVTRFKCVTDMKITSKEVLEGLAAFAFDPKNPLSFAEICGFTTVEDPYNGTNFIESEVLHGSVVSAVFRRDTRRVPSSAVKRELAKRIEKYKADTGAEFTSRSVKSEWKEDIKHNLLMNTPFKTELIPFFYDTEKGVGYFCNTGSSAYSSFEDAFSRGFGFSIEAEGFDCGLDFLSWLWWRIETNDLSQPENAEISIGSRFSVSDYNTKALSGSASDAEIRLAIADQCNVTKMRVAPIGDTHEMTVSSNGKIFSIYIPKEDLPNKESASILPIVARLDSAYAIFDAWGKEYRDNPKSVENFHKSKKAWARPSVCGAAFDDI